MLKDREELKALMEWATTRDEKTPMTTDSIDTLVSKIGTMEKRGYLLVALVDQEEESMRTEMTVQVDKDAHPMVKLLTMVAKTLVQDFFEALKDKSGRPNPAKLTIQHFIAMSKAAMDMDKQQKAADEAEKTKEDVKDA